MTGIAHYPEVEPYAQGMLDVGDGQSIHWSVCGNPDGKPAVVVHGVPARGSHLGGPGTSTRAPTASSCSTSVVAVAAPRTPAPR